VVEKKVLSEITLYCGDVEMPKGFEIDRKKLQEDILKSPYIREHINVEYSFQLINKEIWGNVYKPKEISIPLLNIDPVDLRNSPDYILLYGVNIKDCSVRIHYDDNRRAGRSWDIPLTNNKFVMFPSMQMYYITNTQKDSLNFIQTITYEFI